MKRASRSAALIALLPTVALSLWGAPRRAFADASGNDVAATALFDEGRKLMAAHKYSDACPKLAESQRLSPSGGTLINLAQCYEHTGQTASAWLAWKEAAARASSAGKEDAEKSALSHASQLEPGLAKLTIAVDPASDVAGLEVKRDGVVVGHAEFGVPIPVDPGPHTVAATAPQKKAWSAPVSVAPKETDARVTVTLVDDPAAAQIVATGPAPGATPPTEGPVTPAAEAPAHAGGSPLRTAGWVTAGVGVAGIAVGSIFGLVAKSKNDEATNQDGCTGSHCVGPNAAAGAAASSDANSAATVSTVAFIAGGVALATGVVLVLVAPSGSAVTVAPAVGQSSAGLIAFGTF